MTFTFRKVKFEFYKKKKLKELNELQDRLTRERYDFWKECAQAHKDYESLKKSKRDLWVECEIHKKVYEILK